MSLLARPPLAVVCTVLALSGCVTAGPAVAAEPGCGHGRSLRYVVTFDRGTDDPPVNVDSGRFTRSIVGMLDAERESELEMYTTSGHLAEAFDLEGPNFSCPAGCLLRR